MKIFSTANCRDLIAYQAAFDPAVMTDSEVGLKPLEADQANSEDAPHELDLLEEVMSDTSDLVNEVFHAVFNDHSIDPCEILSNREMLQATTESEYTFELLGPCDFEPALQRPALERCFAMYAARLRSKIFEKLYEAGALTPVGFALKQQDALRWYFRLRDTLTQEVAVA